MTTPDASKQPYQHSANAMQAFVFSFVKHITPKNITLLHLGHGVYSMWHCSCSIVRWPSKMSQKRCTKAWISNGLCSPTTSCAHITIRWTLPCICVGTLAQKGGCGDASGRPPYTNSHRRQGGRMRPTILHNLH